jgi:branched-chain amino acid transport system permease protein
MDFSATVTFPALLQQVLVGLSRTTILFIVASGLSLVLGVLRIPNVAHGSLYMTGAFVTYSVATLFGQSALGFWLALIVAPLVVALLKFLGGAGGVLSPV